MNEVLGGVFSVFFLMFKLVKFLDWILSVKVLILCSSPA